MALSHNRWMGVRALGRTATLLGLLALPVWSQEDVVESAVAALERGTFSVAEQILREQLRVQPSDHDALSVLGVVLDREKKYDEADAVYRQALALPLPDAALLNNFGNHLLATGKPDQARKVFLKAITLEPQNVNGLVQLARLSLQNKAAVEALGYLDRIATPTQHRPDAVMLRMQAHYAMGQQRKGDAILALLSPKAENDAGRNFALGVALASVGQYEKAETFFSKAAEAEPSNFETLYDLGLAASHAGHKERARSVLKDAAAQQPENVNVLYDLATVDGALDDKEAALALLAKASRLAPQRADVRQLEARTAAELGYFGDARDAWNQYLKLVPGDESARRDRAFIETAIGENTQENRAELNAFVRRHPGDAIGHYELGTAEAAQQPEEAWRELNRALALQSDLTGARVARGLLLYRQAKPKEALTDFEFASRVEPTNGTLLDRLGETYLALDRASDAVPVLRKAAELLPSNSTVLLHLGRALSITDQQQEARSVFARCRELGPNRSAGPHSTGLVEFLGLSPDEQRSRYRAGVEYTMRKNPDNIEAQVRYLGILLEENRTSDAVALVSTLSSSKLSPSLLTDSVHMLLSARQYSSAKQLIEQSGSVKSPESALNLAIASFHLEGAEAGLRALQQIPYAQQGGDFHLVEAQMLEEQGQPKDALLGIQKAMHETTNRPELYCAAALLLIKNEHFAEAHQLLARALQTTPDDGDLLLLQAFTLAREGSPVSSDAQFRKIENRWPEWYKPWLLHALVLESVGQQKQAETLRQTAAMSGAPPEMLQLGQASLSAPNLTATIGLLFP